MKKNMRLAALSVLCITALACGLLSGCGTGGKSLGVVKLDSGQISGLEQDGTWTYLGIPYAKPPVGNLRWKPPEPAKPWSGTRACTRFGPSCPQPTNDTTTGRMSEDCLYLNVWTPAKSSSEKLPVMVWIHGGAFAEGSGSDTVYNGHNLSNQGVVVVTINYRLGPFGFLAYPALSKESPQGVSGNYGLEDQVQALKWVKGNIAAFGGNPTNVTIFGESAGAESVDMLLVSPQSKGLFKRAISESGPQWHFGFLPPITSLSDGEKIGGQFATELGCSSASDPLAAMRAKTPDELLTTWGWTEQKVSPPIGLQFFPVVDGWFLPDQPTTLFKEGKQHDVGVIIGSNKDDGSEFGGLGQLNKVTAAQYQSLVQSNAGQSAAEVLNLFPAQTDAQVPAAMSDLMTQMDFASFPRFVAGSVVKTKSKAFLYQFTRVPPTEAGAQLGAYHAAELPYVFGNLDTSQGYNQTDLTLSKTIVGYWTSFAKTGNPNGSGQVEWPSYGNSDQNLALGDQVTTNSGLYKAQIDLAEKIYAGGKP